MGPCQRGYLLVVEVLLVTGTLQDGLMGGLPSWEKQQAEKAGG